MIGAFVAWTDRANSPGWVIDGDGCHIWVGARNNNGYAQANVLAKRMLVYRVRYEAEIGLIPDGTELHHTCNRGADGCCNPRHCVPLTHRQNIMESDNLFAVNARKTHCPRGHPLSGRNLVAYFLKERGARACRICYNERCKLASRKARAVRKEQLLQLVGT